MRRSRIQIKPNTGRTGDGGVAKPAAKVPTSPAPRKRSVAAPPVQSVSTGAIPTSLQEPRELSCVPTVSATPVESSVSEVIADEAPPRPPSAHSTEESVVCAAPCITNVACDTTEAAPVPVSEDPLAPAPVPPRTPVPVVEVVEDSSPRLLRPTKRPATVEVSDASNTAASNGAPELTISGSPPTSPTGPLAKVPAGQPAKSTAGHTGSRSSAAATPQPRKRRTEKQPRQATRSSNRKPPPDRRAMTMMDLIYYNPPGNPMPEKAPKVRVLEPELAEPAAEEAPVDDEVPEASNGPRVRVGPNGEITLDEESLVVRRQAVRPEARALVYETGSETSYTSFRRQPQSRRTWTAKETARFYRALSVCGTDFTLMASFFPKRTRQDLKNKFKREERLNRDLVDRTINDPTQFDLVGLEEELDEPDDPEPAPPKRTARRGRRKRSPEPPVVEETIEEVVEEEVVQDEVIIEEDQCVDNSVSLEAEPPRVNTPPVTQPAQATTSSSSLQPSLGLQPGQLVFYASRTQEQVVHVFVVSPQGSPAPSELVNRLSSPPLRSLPSKVSPPTAS